MISIILISIILFYFIFFYYTVTMFLVFWLVFIGMLVQVMVFTACESNVLALMQSRVGPSYVGLKGSLQYLADSLNLLVNVFAGPRRINSMMFQNAAFGGFWMSWFNFGTISYGPGLDIIELEYSVFFIICISLFFSVAWILAGWSGSSNYSLLGCLSAGVQFIIFEILMGTIILIIFTLSSAFNFELIVDSQYYISYGLLSLPLALIALFTMFMETNSPPFDLSEAESDLVAGYNVEYSGILFGLFYLGEYLNLFATCVVLIIFFSGGWLIEIYYLNYLFNTLVFLFNSLII